METTSANKAAVTDICCSSPTPCPASPATPNSWRLPRSHLVLAIADCIRDHGRTSNGTALELALERLWREDPEDVAEVYQLLALTGLDRSFSDDEGRHGLQAQRLKKLRRPLPSRDRPGLTLRDIAERTGINRKRQLTPALPG